MRELKSKSQSLQPDQVEPEGHPSRSSKSKKHDVDLDRAVSALADAAPEAPVQEAIPTRKRRAATAKTKPQTTVQAKPIASTSVKLTWEPTQPSIVVRFQRLEQELRQLKTQADQINQQAIEIQSEMQELRTIAHTAHPSRPAEATVKQPIQSSNLDIPPFLLDRRTPKPEAAQPLSQETTIPLASHQDRSSVAQPNPLDTLPRFSTSPRPKVAGGSASSHASLLLEATSAPTATAADARSDRDRCHDLDLCCRRAAHWANVFGGIFAFLGVADFALAVCSGCVSGVSSVLCAQVESRFYLSAAADCVRAIGLEESYDASQLVKTV